MSNLACRIVLLSTFFLKPQPRVVRGLQGPAALGRAPQRLEVAVGAVRPLASLRAVLPQGFAHAVQVDREITFSGAAAVRFAFGGWEEIGVFLDGGEVIPGVLALGFPVVVPETFPPVNLWVFELREVGSSAPVEVPHQTRRQKLCSSLERCRSSHIL